MKLKFNGFLALLLVLITQITFAQDIAVTGVVQDQTGMPVPGANVLVKGTSNGVQTDFDGKFKISAAKGQVLVFSFLGMKSQELPASANMTVKLTDDSVQLEGVVVTAMGITRDKRSLGYAAQKLEGDVVNSTPTNNFINNLSGKVAGLEIRKNANFGGSSNIVLRGTKSISGNNQALIVVDGVPINNANLNNVQAANGRDGFDFGNSASDIDPNNIESLTVLKGAAATALYGSQAANGAIMITTKKGKQGSGLGITFSSTTSVGQYDKDTFTRYQKQYGQGYGGEDSFLVQDVDGDGVDDLVSSIGDDASYGPAFDGSKLVYNWDAFEPGNPNFGKKTPWVAAKNDPRSFFQNSFGAVNSININGGDDKSTFNFGFSNNYQEGILPNSRLNRNNITGNFSRNLSDKMKATAFINFSDQTTVGRNSVGYGDNVIGGFRQWWPTNVDIKELRDSYNRNPGVNATWNYLDGPGGDRSAYYWNNPYWDRYENYSSDERTRMLTGANLSYDITKNFNVLGRVTVDKANDKQEMRKAIGSHAEEFGVTQETIGSGYNVYTRDFIQTTYDFIASYDAKITENIGAKFLAGTTFIKAAVDEIEASSTGGLAAPMVYNLSNSNVFVAPIEEEYDYEKFGMYAQASLDYKNTFFLEGAYRRDQSTALHPNHDTYDYFSVGTSLVFSEFIKKDWLSLAKLRGSYAEVGNDPQYGRLGARLNNGLATYPLFGNSSVYTEYQNLKSESQKTWEFGLETSMFNRRLNLDVSIYKINTFDQIFNVPQSASTSYLTSQLNAGELQNKGIEIALSGYPIKTDNFQWMIGANWSKNENELIKLDEGRDNLVLSSWQGGVSLNATVGQPYGALRGTDFVYDSNGNKVMEDGYYLTEGNKVIGNIQADWIAGITNRFTYKNLSFSFLIDIKKGGDLYSLDQEFADYTGLTYDTAFTNDLGNPVRSPLTDDASSGGVIFPGVNADGTPNTTRIDASTAGSAYGNGALPNKQYIYDASYVKLREVGLTYNFSKKMLNDSAISGLSISLLGNNLWIIDKNVPYADPEAGTSSGNVQGFQSGVMPSEKVYSFNVKVNF